MGEEYTYRCRSCGHEIALQIGDYNCKGWGDRKSYGEIMGCKYGKKAKDALSAHPHCLFHFRTDVFTCDCGYTKSYDSLLIHDNDILEPEVYFSTPHRCPRCKKYMQVLDDFPDTIRCHRCGDDMEKDWRSLFRWAQSSSE